MAGGLKRGDLVWVAEKSAYLNKPRPCVIVQSNIVANLRDSITFAP